MACKTADGAHSVHSTNPQYLVEKIIRSRIYDSLYWKESCFALTAESIIDRATSLTHIGGVVSGLIKPSPFLCLALKLLQIQPDKEIVLAYIQDEDFKYLRCLGALYLRLVGTSMDCYKYLEPCLKDFRKIKRMKRDGSFELIHVDEFIDELLIEERSCDIILPRIATRYALEVNDGLDTYDTSLLDDMDYDDVQTAPLARVSQNNGSKTSDTKHKSSLIIPPPPPPPTSAQRVTGTAADNNDDVVVAREAITEMTVEGENIRRSKLTGEPIADDDSESSEDSEEDENDDKATTRAAKDAAGNDAAPRRTSPHPPSPPQDGADKSTKDAKDTSADSKPRAKAPRARTRSPARGRDRRDATRTKDTVSPRRRRSRSASPRRRRDDQRRGGGSRRRSYSRSPPSRRRRSPPPRRRSRSPRRRRSPPRRRSPSPRRRRSPPRRRSRSPRGRRRSPSLRRRSTSPRRSSRRSRSSSSDSSHSSASSRSASPRSRSTSPTNATATDKPKPDDTSSKGTHTSGKSGKSTSSKGKSSSASNSKSKHRLKFKQSGSASKVSSAKDAKSSSGAKTKEEEIVEANALRAKLGLKPLKV